MVGDPLSYDASGKDRAGAAAVFPTDPNALSFYKVYDAQNAPEKFNADNNPLAGIKPGDLFDEDSVVAQKMVSDYLGNKAKVIRMGFGPRKHPEVYAELNKQKYAIMNFLSKGAAAKKAYNAYANDRNMHGYLYDSSPETQAAEAAWVKNPDREANPAFMQKRDNIDFFKKLLDRGDPYEGHRWSTTNGDGTEQVRYDKGYNPATAEQKIADNIKANDMTMNPDWMLFQHTLIDKNIKPLVPNYDQLPVADQAQLLNKAMMDYARLKYQATYTKHETSNMKRNEPTGGSGGAVSSHNVYVSPEATQVSNGVINGDNLDVYTVEKKKVGKLPWSITPTLMDDFLKANPSIEGKDITSMDAEWGSRYSFRPEGIYGLVKVKAYTQNDKGQTVPVGTNTEMWVRMDDKSKEGAVNRGMLKGKVPMPEEALPVALKNANLSWESPTYQHLMGGATKPVAVEKETVKPVIGVEKKKRFY